MISIIICARTNSISDEQRANIEATIGASYEVVVIDNSKNELTIFEAYNIGILKSKGDIFCFMHDDIFFYTQDWGKNVYHHFANDQVGAIGVAGSPYATQMPGSWWGGDLVNQQLLINKNGVSKLSTKFHDLKTSNSKAVAVLDGIWLCIRKSLFKQIKFDSTNFKGYHFYDIDICLQVAHLRYELHCVFDIKIEHISEGNVNKQWIINALVLHQKWKTLLPMQIGPLTKEETKLAEFKTLKEFVQILMANNYSAKYSYKFALRVIFENGLGILSFKNSLFFAHKYIKSIIN